MRFLENVHQSNYGKEVIINNFQNKADYLSSKRMRKILRFVFHFQFLKIMIFKYSNTTINLKCFHVLIWQEEHKSLFIKALLKEMTNNWIGFLNIWLPLAWLNAFFPTDNSFSPNFSKPFGKYRTRKGGASHSSFDLVLSLVWLNACNESIQPGT